MKATAGEEEEPPSAASVGGEEKEGQEAAPPLRSSASTCSSSSLPFEAAAPAAAAAFEEERKEEAPVRRKRATAFDEAWAVLGSDNGKNSFSSSSPSTSSPSPPPPPPPPFLPAGSSLGPLPANSRALQALSPGPRAALVAACLAALERGSLESSSEKEETEGEEVEVEVHGVENGEKATAGEPPLSLAARGRAAVAAAASSASLAWLSGAGVEAGAMTTKEGKAGAAPTAFDSLSSGVPEALAALHAAALDAARREEEEEEEEEGDFELSSSASASAAPLLSASSLPRPYSQPLLDAREAARALLERAERGGEAEKEPFSSLSPSSSSSAAAGTSPSSPPPAPPSPAPALLPRAVVPALLLDAAARAADAVASEALSALASSASPSSPSSRAAAGGKTSPSPSPSPSSSSSSLSASGLVSRRLSRSHRSLEGFRNGVALASFLDEGPRDVVDVLEDAIRLVVPGGSGVLASARVPAASFLLSVPSSSGAVSSPASVSSPSSFSRAGERASLSGWRLAFALALELADVATPLITTAAQKLGAASAWLLRELVGRAVGALISGVRAGVGAAAEGARVPFLFGRGGGGERRRREEEEAAAAAAAAAAAVNAAHSAALRRRHRARQQESDFPPSWRLGGSGNGEGSWFGRGSAADA